MQIAHNSETPIEEGMLIGGKRVNGAYKIEIFNPARPDDLVGTVVRGTTDHVDAAVRSAKSAQPTWAAMTYVQRAAALRRALSHLENDIDRRATVFVRENGKPLAQARGDLLSVPKRQKLALDYASQLDAGREFAAVSGRTFTLNRPYGVVVSIALTT